MNDEGIIANPLITPALEQLGFQRFGKPAEVPEIRLLGNRMTFHQAAGDAGLNKNGQELFLDWTAVVDEKGELWALRNGTAKDVKELWSRLIACGFKEETGMFFYCPTKGMVEQLATIRR